MNSGSRLLKYFIIPIAIMAFCIIVLPMAKAEVYAAEEVASGTCGSDLTWVLDSEGTLVIEGNGAMSSYDTSTHAAPWNNYAASITNAIINNGVANIGSCAFYGCNKLASITIPESVTSIGYYAFYGCRSLKSITIPENVTSIGEGVFRDCSSLTSITIPENVTSIGSSAFYGCRSLKSITIPESVTSIGDNTFESCSSLTSITIPESVTSIGDYTFESCSSLTSITIPESVTSIGNYAFNLCTSLTGITIPENVTSIGVGVFLDCRSLTSITIPKGVTSIENFAFKNCISLTGIMIPENVTSIGGGAFEGCISLTSITIPDSVSMIRWDAFYNMGMGNQCTYYLFKNSYADQTITSNNKYYLSERSCNDLQEHFMVFKQSDVNIIKDDVIELSDYIVSNEIIDWETAAVSIDDESIAYYDNGQLAGLSEGSTQIEVADGSNTCKATINVIDHVIELETITFEEISVVINKATEAYYQPKFMPTNTTQQELTWESTNEDVVTVSEGAIKAVAPGEARITATSSTGIVGSYTVTVEAPLLDLCIVNSSEIEKGSKSRLRYYQYPYDTTDSNPVEFASSNPEVLAINENGQIDAFKVGSATITVTKGEISKSINIDVISKLVGISLNRSSIKAAINDKVQLEILPDPIDATNIDTIEWDSNKESVAVVDNEGLVTIKGKGIATITATVNNEFSAKCNVVCNEVSMTGISVIDMNIEYGKISDLVIEYLPNNTTDDRTTLLTSNNEDVVKVTSDNRIEAVELGDATITATCGEFSDSCTVTVVKATPDYTVPDNLETTCNSALNTVELPDGFTWKNGSESVGAAGEKHFLASFTPADLDHYAVTEDLEIPIIVNHAFSDEPFSDTDSHWRECVCGQKTDITPHDWYADYILDQEPTCTEPGSKSIHCKICDARKQITEIGALGHVYAESVIDPTCSQPGHTLHICGRCGDSYTDNESAATGHIFGEWVTDTDSTCTSEGIQHHECSVCGYTETKGVNKKEHVFATEFTVDKEADCTTDGSKSFHCIAEGCTATTGSEVIPATGHQYTEWVETRKPSCTEDGEVERSCSVCGIKETIHFEPRGHIWNTEPTVDKIATCTEEGFQSIHCAVCGAKDETTVTVIPKEKHAYGDWKTTKEATCTEDGSKEKGCSACGDKITEAIPSPGHIWNTEPTVDKKATCTEEGSQSIHCAVCGAKDEMTVTVIPKEKHAYGDWKTTKEVTCTEDGSKEKDCSRCGDTITETIAAPGHQWNTKYIVDKEATYAAKGSKSIHCSVCDAIKSGSAVAIPKLVVKPTTLSSLAVAAKAFTVKWKKGTGITGYQIQYAFNSKFTSGKKTVKITKAGTVSKKITKLKAKKKYYVRVRTYKTVSGKTYYSTWSKAKAVTTKK